MVLLFDPYALFGLDGLVQTIGPPPSFEDATGELVDDANLAVGDDVVVVAVVELFRLECLSELVDEVHRHRVVEVLDCELAFDLGDALFGRDDDPFLLVDFVVDVSLQRPHDARELVVEAGRVVRRAGDDERGTRLVDEDRVDLVDDRVGVATLHHLGATRRHVVAQVVEAELGVRAVGDVGRVRGTLFLEVDDVGDDESDGKAEEPVDRAHPFGVAACEVVVHGDDVDTPALEGVQVDRQRRDEGLSFAGLHFGDPAEVERHPAHQLDVEVALADGALRRPRARPRTPRRGVR